MHFAWGRGLPLLYRPRRAPPGTEGDSSSSGRVLPIGQRRRQRRRQEGNRDLNLLLDGQASDTEKKQKAFCKLFLVELRVGKFNLGTKKGRTGIKHHIRRRANAVARLPVLSPDLDL